MLSWNVLTGDCRDVLRSLAAGSAHTCVTSPPYFGLRDYGHNGQIGIEPTPEEFVAALVETFRDVRRVLRDDGTLWLNLGDTYAQYDGQGNLDEPRAPGQHGAFRVSPNLGTVAENRGPGRHSLPPGLKRKDLIGIPWMVAFALRADGWYLRSDIIWAKPNPMPESVTDRPTKAHEYVFLLSKGPRYFYDVDAIRESATVHDRPAGIVKDGSGSYEADAGRNDGGRERSTTRGFGADETGRNKRSVWTVATQPYAGAHFATFPPALIEPCILAGCPERCCGSCGAPWERVVERESRPNWAPDVNTQKHDGTHYRPNIGGGVGNDRRATRQIGFEPSCECNAAVVPGTVLDPFNGAGTTGMVALRRNRSYVGIELNPEYADLARDRIRDDAPLLNTHAEAA